MDTFEKIDEQTLQVTKILEPDVVTYDISFLKTQRETIQAQKDKDNIQRDQELAEVDTLLAKAESLGIKEAVTNDQTL
jgi:hypothetical protein